MIQSKIIWSLSVNLLFRGRLRPPWSPVRLSIRTKCTYFCHLLTTWIKRRQWMTIRIHFMISLWIYRKIWISKWFVWKSLVVVSTVFSGGQQKKERIKVHGIIALCENYEHHLIQSLIWSQHCHVVKQVVWLLYRYSNRFIYKISSSKPLKIQTYPLFRQVWIIFPSFSTPSFSQIIHYISDFRIVPYKVFI